MSTFAEELRELVARWQDAISTTDEDIIVALMDQIEELDPPDDD